MNTTKNRMSARQQVLAFAAEHDIDVQDQSARRTELDLNLWTPAGKIWMATGGHSLSIHYFNDKSAGWAALLDDIRQGLADCTEVDCEGCEG